ncbi:MAG: TonB-dependent receptor plug domain-containing protein [Flavobacteriales bacterium]|nr:TonB-dependent receptor plug domain-containing protein [Flavobacteriales bacterium]
MKNYIAVFAVIYLLSITAKAQTLSGFVYDINGTPLPSSTVIVDGSIGVFCDYNGHYEILELSIGKHSIEFSFIGYLKQTFEIDITKGENNLNARLKEDAVLINDVVVVGYGVQRRKEVTGSIAKIDAKKITAVQTPSFEAALQGQAAGVQVSQSSGAAGAGSLIRIRGVASISGSGDPLVVVDGIPITQEYFLNRRAGYGGGFNNNPLASINPNDIASVEILKDAAATGIYGSRGANGVILITTKRGTSKTSFEYSSRIGFSKVASKPNMMNTEEYLTIRQEAWENDGGTGYVWLPHMSSSTDSPESRKAAYIRAVETNTDWVNETIGTGMKNAHSFGARTGGDKWSMYAGFAYDDNESYMMGNSYTRISGRINLDADIASWAKLLFSGSMSEGRNQRISMAWSGG